MLIHHVLVAAAPAVLGLLPNTAQESRTFNVSPLAVASPTDAVYLQKTPVVPLMRMRDGIRGPNRRDGEVSYDTLESTLVRIFSRAHSPSIEQVDILPNRSIVMTADAATLDKFAGLIEQVKQQIAATPKLVVTRLDGSVDLPTGNMPTSEFDANLKGAASPFSTSTIPLASGVVQSLNSLVTDTVYADNDIQIAQAALIGDPIVLEMATGFSMTVVAEPLGDGATSKVSYVIRSTRTTGSGGAIPVVIRGAIHGTESGQITPLEETWASGYRVRGGVLAGSTILGAGETAVVRLRTGPEEQSYYALTIEVPNKSANVPASASGVSVAPSRFGGTSGIGVESQTIVRPNLTEIPVNAIDAEEDYVFYASLECSANIDDLEAYLPDFQDRDFASIYGLDLWVGDMEHPLTRATGSEPLPQRFDVSISTGMKGGSETLSMTTLDGDTSAFSFGRERLIGKDVDVEVAQHAAARDVMTSTHFQGALGSLRVASLGEGSLAYSFQGQLAEDRDVRTTSLGADGGGGFEQTTVDQDIFDESGVVSRSDDGSYVIELGEKSKGVAELTLRLTSSAK